MNPERTAYAIARLSHLVQQIPSDGIHNLKDYEHWAASNEGEIANRLGYIRKTGMPPAHLLVKPFFHPSLPLIGLNYNHDAQRLLRSHPEGWTDALRYCRGTIFERQTGDLIALTYAKFFNLFSQEHPEADDPPDGPIESTVKLDGHLGIIFCYRQAWHVTTHGSFVSRSAKLGTEMLLKLASRDKLLLWQDVELQKLTLLVEIIHPSTRIRCDYHGHQGLVLTGAMDRVDFLDKSYSELAALGERLGMHVTDIWNGFTLDELRREVAEQKPKNREGFVIRFANGMRGKLKYKSYLDKMSDQNLSYNALTHSFMSRTLKSRMDSLPEELWEYADDMWKKLDQARHMPDPKQAQTFLYGLVPPEKSTSYYRKLCRDFLAHRG